jgi:hypothetical protein
MGESLSGDMPLPILKSTHRSLWLGIGWVLSAWALWQGISYTAAGNGQVHSPSLYVLAHEVPGGMRTHGIVMICLAVAFIYQLKETSRATKYVLQVFCGYCVLVAISIVGSWWITDQVVFGAPGFWLAFAAISGVMILYPPPPRGSGDV